MPAMTGATAAPGAGTPPLLSLRGISKAFPGCLANDAIDIDVASGSIHALLGQNGAGKSTLVKIVYGVLKADAGRLLWRGKPTQVRDPAIARALGIAMVFQHFSLFESLTVLDNIRLGLPPQQDTADLRDRTVAVSEQYGLPLNPDRHVYTLSVGERQRIEIVRCLLQEPALLIMDEPTSVLTPQEVDKLFDTLQRLAGEGMAILYISHKLDEIRALCDSATILRDGRKVHTTDPRQESSESLAQLMIGSTLSPAPVRAHWSAGEIRLRVRDLSLPAPDSFGIALQQVNLELYAGQILGVAGVAGNGQDELLQAICGELAAPQPQAIELLGQAAGLYSAARRRRLGLCAVPEQRLGHAAVPDMSLEDNALLTGFHRLPLARGGLIRTARTREFAMRIMARFGVQCAGSHSHAGSLSGGNLQKFVVGRELEQRPQVLVVAQPTWGVDAGAAAVIRHALVELAEGGCAVLVISQDLDELLQLSHHLAAICAGRLSAA